MPIIKGIRRISPLDINKNISIGLAFPLDETNMFSGTETVEEQTRSNLIDVLLTYPGERVNLPSFGVGVKHLLFEQNIDLSLLQEKIQTQASQYMGNIEIKEITSGLSDDQHTVFLNITYRTITGVEDENIQLNFN